MCFTVAPWLSSYLAAALASDDVDWADVRAAVRAGVVVL